MTHTTLVIIPINQDETATAYDEGLPYTEGQTGWTRETIDAVFVQCDETPPANDDAMDVVIEDMEELCGIYGMTHLVVINKTDVPKVAEWSHTAIEVEGYDDSSWYEACERFNDKVLNIAVKVIEV